MSDTQHLYRLIHDIYVLLDDGDNRVLRRFGLTTSQYAVLRLLDPEQGQHLITLSDTLLRARSTITRLVAQLESLGLIERHADTRDRRAQFVRLTPLGVDVRHRAQAAHEQSLVERLGKLVPQEQGQLVHLLVGLRRVLEIELAKEV